MTQPDDPPQNPPSPSESASAPSSYPSAPGYPPPGSYPPAPGYQPMPGQPYGSFQGVPMAVPSGMYFDQSSGLVMPNGTELASVGRRIGAWFLSIVLFFVTLIIGYIIWGLILWGRGQTPALQVLGMRVWRPAENRPASWGYMALREIVGRIVDGILSIVTGIISFVLMVTGKERKSLHDHIAGTVVLHDPNKVIRV